MVLGKSCITLMMSRTFSAFFSDIVMLSIIPRSALSSGFKYLNSTVTFALLVL